MQPLREMKKINITYKFIRSSTMIYLLVPFLIFMAGWVKAVLSIPAIVLLAVGLYKQYGENSDLKKAIKIDGISIGLIMVIAFLWCWSAGIGGFFYQSPDHQFRNAVFHDLVSESWPVRYEKYGTGLVYYLGIWIVPAVFGKIALWVGLPQDYAWTVSGAVLLLWCSAGVMLLVLLLCFYFKQSTLQGIIVLLMVTVGFSGLDIIGELWKNGFPIGDHIEWWSGYFQFRSNTTGLFWAYNQAVPCWLMTVLLLSEENVRSFGFVLGVTLFYSPFAVVGVAGCAMVMAARMLWIQWRSGRRKQAWKDCLSYHNITAVFIIVPVLSAYYACNAGVSSRIRLCWEDYGGVRSGIIGTWILFLLLEAGIYICLFIRQEYQNPLANMTILTLIAGSVLSIGEAGEVVFRISATMPALFILMCFVIKIIFAGDKRSRIAALLVISIGAGTPVTEYLRAIDTMAQCGTICAVADDMRTLDREDAPRNFIGFHIADSLFGQYIAR